VWDRNSPVIRALPWLLALALLLLILRLAPAGLGHVAPVFLTAIVVAAATAPAADALERYRIPRGVTVLAIYLVVAAVFVSLVLLLTPVAITEIRLARDALPGYGRDLQDLIERIAPGQADQISAERLTDRAVDQIGGLLGRATDLALATTTVLLQALIVLVMAYFMVVEADFAQRVVRRFTPAPHRERTVRVLSTIGTKLGQWARAQALLAIFFGVAFGLGLKLLGVHYGLTLGLVGGVIEIIPYVGGAITLILAVFVAGTQSPWLVLWTIVLYTVVVQIQAHVLGPLLIGKAVGLHPLVVVIALFIGIETLGVLGGLLAVPLAIVIQVLLDEFFAAAPDITGPALPVQSPESEPEPSLPR
jgi:predicted PurR-regulated permease PerM